ncbi:MAG: hypothetical protein SYR96_22575 [Actinomycetota bacterium]|nr:hypothetical protein [Actinomycetota bacterium]
MGRRDDLTRRQDRLLWPDQLAVHDDTLVFRVENQVVAEWGVPLAALAEADPPVVFRLASSGTGWRPYLDRVSLAGLDMVLSEWLMAGDLRDLDTAALTELEKRFRPLPMPEYPLWAEADGPPTRWFAGDGVILRVDIGEWLWARGKTSRELAAVRQALPGDWLLTEEG